MSDHTLQLADSIAKLHYEHDFYAHLSMLASVEFAFNPDLSKAGMESSYSGFKFDQRKYISLQQAAFEEGPKIESDETPNVDWEKIDKKVYAFQNRLYGTINGDLNDTRLKKFTDFSVKCYENCITYESMYPQSTSNPWQPVVKILECGRLLYVSDSLNELKDFTNNSISSSVSKKNRGNIGIVVKGQAPTIRGFVIDDRYDIQKIVYSFLRREAPSHESPVSLSKIQAYLKTLGYTWSIGNIQIKITTPLKKTGFVGSTSKGFFVIQTLNDLISSYRFHRTKVDSINTIIEQYHIRSREFGDIDLQKEFGGLTINRID